MMTNIRALAGVNNDDVVLDLGCGDGRVVLEAARQGARGVGIDYSRVLLALCRRRAAKV